MSPRSITLVRLIIAALTVIGMDIRNICRVMPFCPAFTLDILIFEIVIKYMRPPIDPKETPSIVIAEIIGALIPALAEKCAAQSPVTSLNAASIICETAISISRKSALSEPLITLARDMKIIDGATAIIVIADLLLPINLASGVEKTVKIAKDIRPTNENIFAATDIISSLFL
jgi:hypothetical protein